MTEVAESGEYFEWLIHLTRGQLLDLILEIEERLRRLLRTVLEKERSDWEALIPLSVRSKLEEKANPANASGDLLDWADLGQLIDLALTQWKRFNGLLGDKQKFYVRANEFREWRNSLAHGKDPSADEKVEIAVIVRQVGRQIPVVETPEQRRPGQELSRTRVLWVDDHPEWTLVERQVLRALGIEVVPVLSNDEAIGVANQHPFDLVISDIDHGDDETGDLLPGRFRAVGLDVPFLFYVGFVDASRGTPAGALSITADRAILVREVLNALSDHATPSLAV